MFDNSIKKKKIAKSSITSLYTASLVVLGLMAAGGHQYVHNVKKTKDNIGIQLDLAGRQRMLSQRLSKDIFILSENPKKDIIYTELIQTLNKFEKVQKGLVNGDVDLKLSGIKNDESLMSLYKDVEPVFVRMTEISKIIEHAKESDRERIADELKYDFLTNESLYIQTMDKIVMNYVTNNDSFEEHIDYIENLILVSILLFIAFIGFGIFRPLTKFINLSFKSIEIEKQELENIIEYRTKEVRTLSSAVEQSPVAILITNKDGLIQYINPAFTKVTGYEIQDVINRNPSMLASGDTNSDVYEKLWSRVLNKKTWSGILKNKHKSGGIRFMYSTIAPIIDKGVITNFIGIQQDITDRINSEQNLIESEARIAAIMNTVPDAIITINMDGTVNSCNKAAENIFGYSASEMLGQQVDRIAPDELKDTYRERISKFAENANPLQIGPRIEIEAITKSGKRIWIDMSLSIVEAGDKRYITGLLRDISDKKIVEEENRISAVAFDTQEGIFVTDACGKILKVNNAFTELTGYSSNDAVGQSPALLKSGYHDDVFYKNMYHDLAVHKVWKGEIWNKRKNGEVFPEWQTVTAVTDTHGKVTHYVSIFTDITLRKQAEENIKNLAFYDPLTKLPNRRLLIDRITHAIQNANRSNTYNAIMFLDLDHFKNLNDTQGHDKGDLLLKEVALRLVQSVRAGDTVARLSGDEFVIMLENLGTIKDKAVSFTEQIAEKIGNNLNNPYLLVSDDGDTEYNCSASIGICLFNDDISVEDVLKHADVAMYQSKNAGRNTIKFFDPQMQTFVQERIKLESDLRHAISKNNLYLTYQVQVDVDKRPVGAEALVRWVHPEIGFVSPAKFIPLAEDTGLIYELGLLVLEQVCEQIKHWENHSIISNLNIAVNVSAKQFRQDNFIDDFISIVNKHQVPFNKLKIELTESALMNNINDMISKMCILRNLGCEISLDDFGTGYSSLSYLKLLPLNQLKIDQSFTRDILVDHSDEAIASIIISLGHTLELNVIAEGVETYDQYKLLRSYDCLYYQGYLFSKPVIAKEFESVVEALESSYQEKNK